MKIVRCVPAERIVDEPSVPSVVSARVADCFSYRRDLGSAGRVYGALK